ncbi:MAG: Rid family hydrolase [Pseudomonadota bacterium]
MSAKRENLSTGSHFEKTYGYSRAVKVGEQVFVSGTVGLNYDTGVMPEDPVEQFKQSVANIERALGMAGAKLAEVVTLTVYISDPAIMQLIGPSLSQTFGPVGPTNTAVVVGFPVPEIKIELQVMAIIGCSPA